MKNAFYFILKSFFFFKIFKFCHEFFLKFLICKFFGHVGRRLDQKGYPDSCPPRNIVPGQDWGLGQAQGQFQGWGATKQLPPRKIDPQLGLGFGLRLVLGLGGNFPWGQLSQNHQKDKINFKIHNVNTWLTNNYNTHIAQYLTK